MKKRMTLFRILSVCMALVVSNARAELETFTQREGYVEEIAKKAVARDFADLDRQADELRRSRARAPDGLWKLALLYRG